ncbi:hypothetical protein CRG98_027419 [Punica granatum]|uniref:Uncharacterized protein n=1 Tax=Punica granatum TaxID=22663 RepID=A0A2I0J836_PUNGR|nr:hypothetical protein CRG98_027419 [Punica granatum]
MTPESLSVKPEKRGGHRGSSGDSTQELFALRTSWLVVKGGREGGVEGEIDELRVEGVSCGFMRRGRMRESEVVGAERAVSSGQSESVGCLRVAGRKLRESEGVVESEIRTDDRGEKGEGDDSRWQGRRVGEEAAAEEEEAGEEEEEARVFAGVEGSEVRGKLGYFCFQGARVYCGSES